MRAGGTHPALRAPTWRLALVILTFIGFGLLTSRAGQIAIGSARATFPIVAFELAGSGDAAERILSESVENLASPEAGVAEVRKLVETAVRRSLWWDFGFIVGYSLLIYKLAPYLGRQRGGSFWLWSGTAIGWGGLLAGVLDIIENVSLFQVLQDTSRDAWALAAAAASWSKWVLVAIAVAYGLGGLIGLGVEAIKRRVGNRKVIIPRTKPHRRHR